MDEDREYVRLVDELMQAIGESVESESDDQVGERPSRPS
jgi:hypothetical protein